MLCIIQSFKYLTNKAAMPFRSKGLKYSKINCQFYRFIVFFPTEPSYYIGYEGKINLQGHFQKI